MAFFDFLFKRKGKDTETKADTPPAMPEPAKVDAGVDSTAASFSAVEAEHVEIAAAETVQESVPEVPQSLVEGDSKPEQATPVPADSGVAAPPAVVKEETQRDQEQNGSDQAELDKLCARYANIPYHGTLQTLKAKNPDIKWSAIDHIAAANGTSTLKFLRANTNIFGEPVATAKNAPSEQNAAPKKKVAAKTAPATAVSKTTAAEPAVDQTAGIYERPIYRVEEIDISGDEVADWETIQYREEPDKLYISDYLGKKEHIILPASLNGKKVDGITGNTINAFTKCRAKIVEIPGCYGEVRHSVFHENKHLEKVIIGEGITDVHNYAFYKAENLTEIDLSRSVVHLDSAAFFRAGKGCWQGDYRIVSGILTNYVGAESVMRVPNGVTAIVNLEEDYDFERRTRKKYPKITKIILPDSLTILGDRAFYYRSFNDVQSVEGGRSMGCVCSEAFREDALISQIRGEPVTIGTHLFRYHTEEKNVVIPSFVQSIENECFKEQTLETITLPPHLRSIPKKAFYRCKNLQRIDMPDTVTSIGEEAFAGCEKLKEVHYSKGLKSIGAWSFRGCRQLRDPVLPEGLESIGYGAFMSCAMLKTMRIPDSVYTIRKRAFEGCRKMTAIQLPAGLKEIEENTFKNCTALKDVAFSAKANGTEAAAIGCALQKIDKEAFVGCTALASITIPEGTERIEERAFADCVSMTEIELPETLRRIGKEAFSGCTALASITIPKGTDRIEERAFADCTSLAEVIAPASITFTGKNAFANTAYSKQAHETGGGFTILNGILSEYTGKDKTVVIPETVTEIAETAFKKASKIESLTLPGSIREIKYNIFGIKPFYDPRDGLLHDYNKVTLKNLVLNNGLVSIENFGFYLCPLKRLHLPDTLEKIGKYAFTCIQIPVIRLPRSVKTVGKGAFWGAEELIVYDTIEPNAAPVAEWQYDEQHVNINSALGCALIFAAYYDSLIPCDSKWVSHHITVLSAETGEIKYRLYCDKSERLAFRALWLSGWGKNASFKLKEYDTYFEHASIPAQRDEMAFDRLQYPYELLPEHRAMYEAYLERCLYIEQSAKRVAETIACKDDVPRLQLLEKYHAIGKRSLRWLLEAAKKNHAEKCAAWLNKYAEERSGQA